MVRSSPSRSLFGRRLREARIRAAIPQDKLGVAIGLDEGSSSARISRYETGTHEPPFEMARKLAVALKVPTAFLFCEDDNLAELLLCLSSLSKDKQVAVLKSCLKQIV